MEATRRFVESRRELLAGATLLLLTFFATPHAASVQPVGLIDVATLSTATDDLIRVHGSVGTGAFGVPVAGGFDCDGDGFRDYAMAAMTAAPLGRTNAGEIYLVFGDGTISGSLDTAPFTAGILKIAGDGTSENAGSEIWMDDVTGDGLGDLLIARQNFRAANPDRPGAGALTIVVGGAALRTHAATHAYLDLRSPPAGISVFTIVGAAAVDRLGIWMRTGDATGDGTADIVLGADQEDGPGEIDRGAAYVIRGGPHLATTATIDLAGFGTTALAGHLAKIVPPAGATEFHLGATCQIGDLDGNLTAEVMVAAALNRAGATLAADGAPPGAAHGGGGSPDGTLYIVWDDNFAGDPWVPGLTIDLAAPPGDLTVIDGAPFNRSFGEEILAGRDYDADGSADLFVGDIIGDASGERPSSGTGHVFYGAAALRGVRFTLASPPPGIVLTMFLGADAGDIAGDTASHGDFDGDSLDDLAFSAPHASPLGRTEAGIVYVFRSRARRWPAVVDLRPGLEPPSWVIEIITIVGADGREGSDAGDMLSYSAATGDLDGDGRVDIVTNEMLGNGLLAAAEDTGNLIVIGGSLIVDALPVSDTQTSQQQRCVNEMNARGAAVTHEQGTAGLACLRDAARAKVKRLGTFPQTRTAQACLTNDVRRTVARVIAKLGIRDAQRCLGEPAALPDYAYTGAATTGAATAAASRALVQDLFADDLDAAVVLESADRDAARCQREALKRGQFHLDVLWKEARRGTKNALRGRKRLAGTDPTRPVGSGDELGLEIAAYLTADPSGRVDGSARRLAVHLSRRCGSLTPSLASLFPGGCAGSATIDALGLCVEHRARCRFCESLAAADALAIGCDRFDDAAVNASCKP